jgi:hypothetical protein
MSRLNSTSTRTLVVCALLFGGIATSLIGCVAKPSDTAATISPANTYLPFGPKQLPYTDFGKLPFTGAYVNASTLSTLTQRVEAARQTHTKLILKLAPAHDAMISPTTECFDINLWKDSVKQLFSFDLTPSIADGTVLGAELVNEPHAYDWCLTQRMQVSKAQLEEMGEYVKAVWPTLPVGGGRSDYMAANAPWKYIDFSHSQYHMRKGDVTAWVKTTVQESQAAGVALLISLDYLAGQLDDTAMTAEQLRVNGIALARDPYSCMMTGYLYDAEYQAQPGIMDALYAIAKVANSHPAPHCFVGSSVKPAVTSSTTTSSTTTTVAAPVINGSGAGTLRRGVPLEGSKRLP